MEKPIVKRREILTVKDERGKVFYVCRGCGSRFLTKSDYDHHQTVCGQYGRRTHTRKP